MDIKKKQQEQTAGDNASQNQLIGDHSNQTVIGEQYNVTVSGMPMPDIVRLTATVSAEVTKLAVDMCTQVAEDKVRSKMHDFGQVWIPRITKMEKAVDHLMDPKFQFMLRDANITAAKSSREEDLKMLSELLACHIEKGSNLKIDAGINRAISIVNEVDMDSLCALTVVLTTLGITPNHGDIKSGLAILNDLYTKLITIDLPKGDAWIDNLNVIGAINILSGHFYKTDKILSNRLDGYICAGIQYGSKEHKQAMDLLKANGIPSGFLAPNVCLPGYLRLFIADTGRLDPRLKPVIELYSKDKKLLETAKNNFMDMWDSYDVLKKVKDWFNDIPTFFRINSVGKALAQTYAKKCYPEFPDLI